MATQGRVKVTLHIKAEPDLEGILLQDRELTSKHCLANSMKQAHIERKDQDEIRVI